jgi:hypothetical protein
MSRTRKTTYAGQTTKTPRPASNGRIRGMRTYITRHTLATRTGYGITPPPWHRRHLTGGTGPRGSASFRTSGSQIHLWEAYPSVDWDCWTSSPSGVMVWCLDLDHGARTQRKTRASFVRCPTGESPTACIAFLSGGLQLLNRITIRCAGLLYETDWLGVWCPKWFCYATASKIMNLLLHGWW